MSTSGINSPTARPRNVRRSVTAAALAGVALMACGGVSAAAPSSGNALGSTGYKTLHLGMNKQQAERTGLITDAEVIGSCTWYHLKPSEGTENPGNGVVVSPSKGVVSIDGTQSVHTTKGITMGSVDNAGGSTVSQVIAAYPRYSVHNASEAPIYIAQAPDSVNTHYIFAVGADNKVKDMSVATNNDGGCGLSTN